VRVVHDTWRAAWLPFVIGWRVVREPTARRELVRVAGVQLAIILVALSLMVPGTLRLVEAAINHGGKVKVEGDGDGTLFPALSMLWANLAIVEWTVGWIFREYNDALVRTGSRLVGVRVVEPEAPPRLRVDLGYLWRKLKRRIAIALVLASGAPLFLAAVAIPRAGRWLQGAVVAVWGVYWLAVGIAGKSDFSDEAPADREPWFLRVWQWLVERVFLFRWFLPRWYGRLWRRLTRGGRAAAVSFEEAPLSFAALLGARAVASVPVMSLVLKPYVAAAAGAILVERRRGERGEVAGARAVS